MKVITDSKNKISISLLLLFFLLRIPVTLLLNRNIVFNAGVAMGMQLLYYSIIGLLIWINRADIQKYHFDVISITLYLFGGSLYHQPVVQDPLTPFFEISFWVISISLTILLVRKGISFPSIKRKELMWIIYSILLGFIVSISLTSINPGYLSHPTTKDMPVIWAVSFVTAFKFHMGNASIIEEPIYRGFLWGVMKEGGVKEPVIFVIQALLFMFSHMSFSNHPFSFWFIGPILSILLGFLAWKSRSLFPSMIVHAIYNAYAYTASLR